LAFYLFFGFVDGCTLISGIYADFLMAVSGVECIKGLLRKEQYFFIQQIQNPNPCAAGATLGCVRGCDVLKSYLPGIK